MFSQVQTATLKIIQDGHKVGEKIPRVFQYFPQPLLYFSRGYRNKNFGDLPAFRVTFSHIFTAHCQKKAILADIYWAGSLLPEIIRILLTQSTAVLRKKWFYLL